MSRLSEIDIDRQYREARQKRALDHYGRMVREMEAQKRRNTRLTLLATAVVFVVMCLVAAFGPVAR